MTQLKRMNSNAYYEWNFAETFFINLHMEDDVYPYMHYACLKHIMHYSLGRTNWWYNNKRLKNPCNTCWRTILYLHIMHLYTSKNENFIISFTNYEYICSRLKSRALSLNMH